MSIAGWQDEMEMDGTTSIEGDHFLDHLTPQQLAAPFEEEFHQFYSLEGLSSFATFSQPCNISITPPSLTPELPICYERHMQGLIPKAASSSGDGAIQPQATAGQRNAAEADGRCKRGKAKRGSTPGSKQPQAMDHVIEERNRRAKLSQQFMDLTAIVPCIRKMDKVTILEDSIKYLKRLQENVKKLEEQHSNNIIESAVFVKKSRIHSDRDDEDLTDEFQPLPHIEARVSDRNVLIRIHCEAQKGILVKAVTETESLNLSVVSSGVIPFGNSTLDITLMAQVQEFNTRSVSETGYIYSLFAVLIFKLKPISILSAPNTSSV